MITKGGMYAMLAARYRLEAESLLARPWWRSM